MIVMNVCQGRAAPQSCGRGRMAGTAACTALLAVGLSVMAACGWDDGGSNAAASYPIYRRTTGAAYTLQEPCSLGVAQPTRLFATTADATTGAAAVADVRSHRVSSDVAVASNDPVPFFDAGALYIVNRFNSNNIMRLRADDFALLGEYRVVAQGSANANPQGMAFAADGRAFVSLFDAPEIQIFDFTLPPSQAHIGSIDVAPLDTQDGKPETTFMFRCGTTLFVNVQRLHNYAVTQNGALVAFDTTSYARHTPALELLGRSPRQARLDPTDPTGHTVLILSDGLERLNLDSGRSSWVLSPQEFAAAGLSNALQPQAFAVTAGGEAAYLAAYDPAFTMVNIWKITFSAPATMEQVITGLQAMDKSIELIGEALWFADVSRGQTGLRVYNIATHPPTLVAGPLATGLPPYSLIPLP